MTRHELDQVIVALTNLGFKVEWTDLNAEVLLIRAMPARG
jgi:hypothetical protein